MARGVRAVYKDATIVEIPVADGGDGLIDAIRAAMGGELVSAPAHAPLGEKRRASYLWISDKKIAVIEMARASGLALVPPARRRVMASSTRGTGDLMRDATRRGARTIIVGMGGSASNDGGAGMARALGARLLDCEGKELPDGAADLPRLCSVDARPVKILLSGVKVIALSDVTNPLLGPKGSARVFGPQKGATPSQVRALERGLEVWARALNRDLRVSVASVPGAGAAGGLGAGLLAFARAEIVPGADWILEKTGAARALKTADLVVTGEGRLDRTSFFGKTPIALARRARRCVAVVGSVQNGLKTPFKRVVTFAQAGARSEADAMKHAARWARKAAEIAVLGAMIAGGAAAVDCKHASLPDLAEIDKVYFHRNVGENLRENEITLDDSYKIFNLGCADKALFWEYRWRLCRIQIRIGEQMEKKSDKLRYYSAARNNCTDAVADPKASADAHFWLGVALGRWAETKGMMKALFAIKTIKKEMAETLKLDPNHGGAHNVLAEILWQVPGIAGGDKKKALAEFETALRLSPRYTANHQPLAEAYLHFGRKEDAIKVLKQVEATKDPADPAEYPDNLADAKKLLERLDAAR